MSNLTKMNFITSSSNLLKQLQSISGVLNSSNTLPILDNFLFDIKDGILTISASDLETTMLTSMDVKSEENGRIAIPARLIMDILKNLPDQPCTIRSSSENNQIDIAYDNGKSKMVGFNGEEFPKLPSVENKNTIKLTGDVLINGINRTIFATGNDEMRPVMNGVYCEFSSDEITFVATDAHKLVRYRKTGADVKGSASFILPKKPLNMIKSNLKSDEEVTLEYNDTNAVFTFGKSVLVCRLIDGKYPPYEAVIPKENPNVLLVDRSQFLGSLKRVSIFSSKSTHEIRLRITGSELSIFAEDIDFSNEANERLTCNYDGDDMEICFNSRYLLQMIENLEDAEIKLSMSEPSRAGIITPSQQKDNSEDLLMLVMPLNLNR